MFSVYCPGHGHRVLLFSDNIEALVNRPGGVELRWRCICGERGIRPAPPAPAVPPVPPAAPVQRAPGALVAAR